MVRWSKKARQILEVASDVSDILIHLRDKPKPTDYISIGFRLANSYFVHADKFRGAAFKKWDLVEIWEFRNFIYEISKHKFEYEVVRDRGPEGSDLVAEIYGVKIGWSVREDYVHGPYAEKGKRTKCLRALGRLVWETLQTNSCELAKKRGDRDYDGSTIFSVDNLQNNVYESAVANNILKRSKAFLDAGYNRSIMLYGRPGTGKSSAMRYIAKKLGKYSLRINVGDLDHLTSEDIMIAIDILRPDTLIIDDFDRAFRPEKLLSDLEEINNSVKMLIVSVNNVQDLSEAVKRPGRFDDIIEIENIDEDIVNRLIGDVPDEIAKRLKMLPVAFIVEFHKRKTVLGIEQAIEEVESLEERIRKISKKEEEEEEEEDEEDEPRTR
jgi:hypothetical protein